MYIVKLVFTFYLYFIIKWGLRWHHVHKSLWVLVVVLRRTAVRQLDVSISCSDRLHIFNMMYQLPLCNFKTYLLWCQVLKHTLSCACKTHLDGWELRKKTDGAQSIFCLNSDSLHLLQTHFLNSFQNLWPCHESGKCGVQKGITDSILYIMDDTL